MSKGSSAHLFKATAKRRRSKAQIEEEKQQEKRQKQEGDAKLVEYERMKRGWQAMEYDVTTAMKVNAEVTKLFDEGLLKAGPDGKYQVVRDPVEEQRIKTEVQSASKKKE